MDLEETLHSEGSRDVNFQRKFTCLDLQRVVFEMVAVCGGLGAHPLTNAPIHGVVFWVDFCSENVPKRDKKKEVAFVPTF